MKLRNKYFNHCSLFTTSVFDFMNFIFQIKRYCLQSVMCSLFLLSGCTASEKSNIESKPLPKQQEPTTLNFLGHWYGEGKREDLVRNITREYEFENQNIDFNMKFPEEVYYKREDFSSNQKFVSQIILEEHPKWDIIRINGQYS